MRGQHVEKEEDTDLGLKGKVAMVTGASMGIERAIVQGITAEGCRLSICARGAEDLDHVTGEIQGRGVDVLTSLLTKLNYSRHFSRL